MKLLVITPNFFPKVNPRSLRWQVVTRQFTQNGWEVHVLCSTHPAYLRTETIGGVHIHRVGHLNMLDALRSVRMKPQFRDEVYRESGGKPPKEGKLIKAGRWLMKHIYWPDGSFIWILPALFKAFWLLKSHRFDAVISVSLPFSSHLVGYGCKRKFSELWWLMDIGDPFASLRTYTLNNHLFYAKLNYFCESRLLKLADKIVLTNQASLSQYEADFPGSINKFSVIPPVYEKAEIKDYQSMLSPGCINFGYFGSFYFKLRPADNLVALLSQIDHVSISPQLPHLISMHIFGHLDEFFLKQINNLKWKGSVELHGLVSRQQALAEMQHCNFLINIGNSTNYQLPSKVVDYMMSGKPVINLVNREDDTSADFFADYPLIINLHNRDGKYSEEDIRKLEEFVSENRGKRVDEDWLRKQEGKYDAIAVAAAYEELLRKD